MWQCTTRTLAYHNSNPFRKFHLLDNLCFVNLYNERQQVCFTVQRRTSCPAGFLTLYLSNWTFGFDIQCMLFFSFQTRNVSFVLKQRFVFLSCKWSIPQSKNPLFPGLHLATWQCRARIGNKQCTPDMGSRVNIFFLSN